MDWKKLLYDIISSVAHWVTTSGIRLVIALILMFISFKIINKLSRRIAKSGDTGKIDKTISKVLSYLSKIGLKILVAIVLVGFVGIDTSGIAALVASLGVGAGLALNGALSNMAGGILIIVTRPFKVDDYIETDGYSGTVEDIHITYTRLCTPDNKVVYVPNGTLSTSTIINYSEKETRRVDFKFSISYSEDFERVKKIVYDICASHKLVLDSPEINVRVSEHGKSSITVVARCWTKSSDYWTVNFDILEEVKKTFDKEGIVIPYDQIDVHVKND